eukprot:NODE_8149_length_399_cov_180.834302.p1 GENE.NODE_8149_length_399_cov_180.834302~~NODE_8149_length_399_cov_180.834302.p1  ORF type:complete len:78 (+),score=26.42 NODE_8149_length_399_cov_180.834302:3-236(+)
MGRDYDAAEGTLVVGTLAGEELRLANVVEMTGAELGEQVRKLKGIKNDVDVKIFYDDATRIAPHEIVRKEMALHARP